MFISGFHTKTTRDAWDAKTGKVFQNHLRLRCQKLGNEAYNAKVQKEAITQMQKITTFHAIKLTQQNQTGYKPVQDISTKNWETPEKKIESHRSPLQLRGFLAKPTRIRSRSLTLVDFDNFL